jgi:hypothetical protein
MKSSEDAALGPAHALKCELAGEVLRSSGKLRLQVTGWSMLPTVWPGDTLVVERAESCAVSAGEIILFSRDRRLFAHRVVGKADELKDAQIITQGDGMARPDPPVAGPAVLGKVSVIIRGGRCIAPGRSLDLPERAVAALVRRSDSAARVVVGIHGMRQPRREPVPCQS